ncbi:type I phosphomannose isomerase catalytic subunit [Salegentibacter salegens]|uniref:Phosphohexomutase n=1 Tax=Salegentibacter salegens TaxID=143223 RepID=A0A1M7IZD3_9FLAO|nr:type I phosphomannose isomerase catalytic subunit [Salegentibacter salegens]PRX49866.1 mannose-6-phosphate isomerase [Salegentibacter salegens]SHM46089.1 mannose-6-phosphate isomerase, type 1 [Salegentibacter salegens]
MLDYPIKFYPILKEKIWGGEKLKTILNKETNREDLGESWEISGVEGAISVVSNGELKGFSLKDLLEEYKDEILGKKIYKEFDADFPLLIKFIDANTELSVQLHPNDDLAQQRHNSFGKTEMWYIMQADKGAKINIGFKESVSKEDYITRLEEGKIVELLNFEEVKKGDSFFINTGKVHAIGAGVLLAEIQQTSDVTYRIYDWDRTDDEGNSRELHTALAIDAIDFEKKDDFKLNYEKAKNTSSEVASCQYFTTNYLPVEGEIKKDYGNLDSFVIYMCVSGKGEVSVNGNSEKIAQGETLLIPAVNKDVKLSGENFELLEVYIK